jgi:ABC-type nitrate/sulfonate/bicarbonate transport system permease component
LVFNKFIYVSTEGSANSTLLQHTLVSLSRIFGAFLLACVAAEMVASTRGLGFMVLNAAEFLASDVVIMGIIMIGFFAFGFDLLMRDVERALVPWKGKV